MHRLRCLLPLLFVGSLGWAVVQAQPHLGDELVASPLVWRAFRPLVLAFGDGDSVRAVSYLRAGTALLRKTDGPLERDATTREFQTKALAQLNEFDLKAFFLLLPGRDGPFRYFAFEGSPTPRAYRFQVSRGKAFEVYANSARRSLGESSGEIRMRHVRADDKLRYLLQWHGGVGVGALSWPALLAGVRDGLRLLEERPSERALPLVLRTAESYLKRTQPALHEEDRRVLASLWGSFPEVSKLLSSVSTTDDVVVADGAPGGVTRVRLITRWDVEKLERAYPWLAEFYRDLGNLIELKARLVDQDGHTLLDVMLDTEHMQSRVEAFVQNGELVPGLQGKPLAGVAPRYGQMRLHANLHFQFFGLHMFVDDLTVALQNRAQAGGDALTLQLTRTPRFRATGAAFGVFPSGMLDWFIPGDIEGLARRMMEVTMRGNDGRGVLMNVRFVRADDGLATLDGSAGLELLDTALIRFGMKIAADRVMPDEQEQRDIARLLLAYRAAFTADLERFAKYGAALIEASEPASPSAL